MKKKLLTYIPLLTCTLAGYGATVIQQDWQFNDTAGTGLQNVVNTGVIATPWNFNFGGEPGEGATDGAGNMVIGYSVTAGSSSISENFTRKAEFPDSPVSSGTYVFEFRISDWDLLATDTLDATAGKEGIKFKIESSTGAQAVTTFEITGNGGEMRTRHASSGSATTTTQGQTTFGLTGAAVGDVVVRVEGDLDTGAWSTSYNIDGVGFENIVTDGGGIEDIASIIMTVEGSNPWASNDYIAIDYATLINETGGGGGVTWNGYEVVDGYADTGSWMGWVEVSSDPWIYVVALEQYIYVEPTAVGEFGGWVYIMK